ncbi:hypothetical protein L7F22_016169 [Adiantum nelumboides]|nr:hypothetical protein [Adiantum nelumboides]
MVPKPKELASTIAKAKQKAQKSVKAAVTSKIDIQALWDRQSHDEAESATTATLWSFENQFSIACDVIWHLLTLHQIMARNHVLISQILVKRNLSTYASSSRSSAMMHRWNMLGILLCLSKLSVGPSMVAKLGVDVCMANITLDDGLAYPLHVWCLTMSSLIRVPLPHVIQELSLDLHGEIAGIVHINYLSQGTSDSQSTITIFENLQDEERIIDFNTLDLHIDIASPDATWAIEFLARKLPEAMTNPTLQGVVHTQLQERHLIVSALEENSPSKSQFKASKRENSNEQKESLTTTRRGQSPSRETKARKKRKDIREKSHVYDVDTHVTSDLDVHPGRRRRTPSPSPPYGRRSSSSPSSCHSKESEKKVKKKWRKKKPSSYLPSQRSSKMESSSSSDSNPTKACKRKGHQHMHAAWKRSSTLRNFW